MKPQERASAGTDSGSRFFDLLDRYERHLRAAGKRVYRAEPARGRRLFEALPYEEQRELLTRLDHELVSLDELVAAGERLSDSPRLLWRYLCRAGYTPTSDIFSTISDTDIVEGYSVQQRHVFQNLRFFDWISVTLEQIYCDPWYLMSERDPEMVHQLGEVSRLVLTGESGGTIFPTVPWHVVRENGVDRFEFDLRVKCVSPITLEGKIVGFIAVNEAKNLRTYELGQPLQKSLDKNCPS